MATTIKTEQRILNLETISGAVKLQSEARLESTGGIVSANGQIQVDNTYVGSFNVSQSSESKLSTNINVSDSVSLSAASSAVNELIADIEAMKTV
nr:hypothetical protein [uncultured Macellibacteroides sp.]